MQHHYKIYADFKEQGVTQRQGTGFFVKSPITGEIYFITNAHVASCNGIKAYGCTITYFQGGHNYKGGAAAEVLDFKEDSAYHSFQNDKNIAFHTDIAVLKITQKYSENFEIHPLEISKTYTNQEKVSISGFAEGILKTIKGVFYCNDEQAAVISQNLLKGGSSGAPVLNSKNQVIALHHRGPGAKFDHINLELIAIPGKDNFTHSYTDVDKPGTLPVQSICMPAGKILSFLKASPHIHF